MAHWINVLRINGFVNPTRLPLLCEKTGALAIVEPGLTGRPGEGARSAGKKGSGYARLGMVAEKGHPPAAPPKAAAPSGTAAAHGGAWSGMLPPEAAAKIVIT